MISVMIQRCNNGLEEKGEVVYLLLCERGIFERFFIHYDPYSLQ